MQTYDITGGNIYPDKDGPPKISPNAHIVVGWEIPNSSLGQALYIFGDTTITSRGYGQFKYSLHIGDSVPKFVVRISGQDTIAIAHIFVTEDPLLRNGDTIAYANCWMNSEVNGTVDGEVFVFRKGNPIIANGISLNIGLSGYNFFHCDCIDGSTLKSVQPDYYPNYDIFMDNNTQDIKYRNPFWLQ
jgi:hypothetical protein